MSGPNTPRFAANRILVIRLGALGDVVRTRFAVSGVRALYPDARIDWLVEDRCRSGLDGITEIDRIVEAPRRLLRLGRPAKTLGALHPLVQDLREASYDLCLDFHGVLKSAVLARLSSTPIRVGYAARVAREQSHLLYTHRVSLAEPHVSRFVRNAGLVRYLGGHVSMTAPPLELPPALERFSDEVSPRSVLLHPGTSPRTRYKRWDPERWSELARGLATELSRPCLVTWGPGERAVAQRIVDGSRGAARLAPETPSVAHLLALLRRSTLLIASDSGPLHLAALVERPVVALFGPTDPVENAPFEGVPARLVRHDSGCNPCREGCPARACMAGIETGQVVAAARGLLAGSESPAGAAARVT